MMNASMTLDYEHTFLTSDHHFKSGDLVSPWNICNEALEEELIEKWNEVVGPSDTVLYLGDFSDGTCLETCDIFKKLNGNISLILGNHDFLGLDIYRCMFKEVHEMLVVDNLAFSHCPVEVDKTLKLFHGHIHHESRDFPAFTSSRYDVAVMLHDGYPVKLSTALKQMDSYAECQKKS